MMLSLSPIALALLKHIRTEYGAPMPTIDPGPDGRLSMTWKDLDDHLNIEVFLDGHIEYLHEDLQSGRLWGTEETGLAFSRTHLRWVREKALVLPSYFTERLVKFISRNTLNVS